MSGPLAQATGLPGGSADPAAAAWHDYWCAPRLAACVPDDPAAAAAIEQHWSAWFAALPAGTRVLDVGTGNGALLLCAARAAPGALELTGVDRAAIDPPRHVPTHRSELAAMRFYAGVKAEQLPFADRSFDVVVSQYGLEYAALGPALAEVARVLVPGGTLHCLAHDAEGAVVAEGRCQLQEMALLLAPDGPFAQMAAYLHCHQRQSGRQQAIAALTASLREAQAYCEANPPATLLRQLCAAILETANHLPQYSLSAVQQWLDENHRRLLQQRQRLLEQQAAALDAARLGVLSAQLRGAPWAGLSCTPLYAHCRDTLLGQVLLSRTLIP